MPRKTQAIISHWSATVAADQATHKTHHLTSRPPVLSSTAVDTQWSPYELLTIGEHHGYSRLTAGFLQALPPSPGHPAVQGSLPAHTEGGSRAGLLNCCLTAARPLRQTQEQCSSPAQARQMGRRARRPQPGCGRSWPLAPTSCSTAEPSQPASSHSGCSRCNLGPTTPLPPLPLTPQGPLARRRPDGSSPYNQLFARQISNGLWQFFHPSPIHALPPHPLLLLRHSAAKTGTRPHSSTSPWPARTVGCERRAPERPKLSERRAIRGRFWRAGARAVPTGCMQPCAAAQPQQLRRRRLHGPPALASDVRPLKFGARS